VSGRRIAVPEASVRKAGRRESDRRLGEQTWEEVAARQPVLVALPLGAVEQHGPHLPLDTDTRVAVALAERLAAARQDTLVAPALPYGSSGEHAGFAGTLSIGQEALEQLVLALARTLGPEVRGLVLVCAHGGNAEPLSRAARQAAWEHRPLLVWPPPGRSGPVRSPERRTVDLHAGRTETSLMLHLAPELVRLDRAASGGPRHPEGLLPVLRKDGVRAVSPSGVLGDPSGASAAEGRDVLERLTEDLCRAVDRVFGPGPSSSGGR
jgi:mycofactocin precursor peptide peptidase